jgi:hypothetical protein
MKFKLKTKYLSIAMKQQLVNEICLNCIVQDTESGNMHILDYIAKELWLTSSLITFYTDIELDKVDLDELMADGTVAKIMRKIPQSEIAFIETALEHKIQSTLANENSLSSVVNKFLDGLLNRIPDGTQMEDILAKIPETLGKLDPKNMAILKSALGNLQKT